MRSVILGLLALSLATPALADPGDNRGRGWDTPPGHARKHDNHRHRDHDRDDRRHDGRHDRDDRRHDREARWEDRDRDDRRDRYHGDRGYRLSRDQLRYLPPLPHGQEYRRIGDDLVSIDSDTLKIVAVLGLISAFLAMR